ASAVARPIPCEAPDSSTTGPVAAGNVAVVFGSVRLMAALPPMQSNAGMSPGRTWLRVAAFVYRVDEGDEPLQIAFGVLLGGPVLGVGDDGAAAARQVLDEVLRRGQ